MRHLSIGLVVLAGMLSTSFADTHYVSTNSPHPTFPYANWETAARTINEAVASAVSGDSIWVTNGTYILTAEILATNEITIQSVNGVDVTTVDGCNSNRCFFLEHSNAVVEGFTITRGQANVGGGVQGGVLYDCSLLNNHASDWGGAAYDSVLHSCQLVSNEAHYGGGAIYSKLDNCEIRGNRAEYGGGTVRGEARHCLFMNNWAGSYGGAVYGGTQYNCLITRNASGYGGGASYDSEFRSCTVVNNSATGTIGGAYSGVAYNSILYYNYAADGQDSWCELHNSCAAPGFIWGRDYFTDPPRIVSPDNPRLMAGSSCIDAGVYEDWMAGTVDLDGRCRTNGTVDIGAYEYWADTKTGAISVVVSASNSPAALGIVMGFSAALSGQVDNCVWDFGDGVTVTGVFETSHSFLTTGTHQVVLTAWNPDGSATGSVCVRVVGTDIYVSADGDDGHDGTAWTNAKATIQAAIDDAWEGATRVLVSNGVYDTGGRTASETLTNRVLIDKSMTLQSMNGPEVTFIVGQASAGGSNDDGAVRCVYMSTGTCLLGFTLMNGHTRRTYTTDCYGKPGSEHCWVSDDSQASGGGVRTESSDLCISNCIFIGNSAYLNGGGVGNATLVNCTFISNSVETGSGGGAYNCVVSNCEFIGNQAPSGGGIHGGSAENCVFENNTATQNGGGANDSAIADCIFRGNSAESGGGTCASFVTNSIYIGNYASGTGGGAGGRTSYSYNKGDLVDCILVSNSSSYGGGICDGSAVRCIIRGNSACYGGGAYAAGLTTCLVYGNSADRGGGVGEYSSLVGCTVARNTALTDGGAGCNCYGVNCILVSNTASENANYRSDYSYGWRFTCSQPLPPGEGCFTNGPCFVDYDGNDFRLASNSPCIDAGTTNDQTMDLDGLPRPLDGDGDGVAVCDLGCYEFVHPAADTDGDGLSDTNEIYVWHTQALAEDSDGDHVMDGNEVAAGTDPLNGNSYFSLDSPILFGSGRLLTWRTVFGKSYWIQRSTDLTSGTWSNLWNYPISELDEYPEGTESFYDLGVSSNRPAIYRVQLDQ